MSEKQPEKVNADNFVRAETDRMFVDIQQSAGGVNRMRHNREPAAIENQLVIRLNRDTLYSFGVVDISKGAKLTLPDAEGRYLSAMIVNNDHFINKVLHEPGVHDLTVAEYDSSHVLVGVRILVDPNNPEDVKTVNELQNAITLSAPSATEFVSPNYDKQSFDETRNSLLVLARGLDGYEHSFGKRADINPIRHLIAAAAGWGGLPDSEASYVGFVPKESNGSYEITMKDVPADAFWSISVYNEQGFFEPNPQNLYTVNSVTGTPNDDGSISVRFIADNGNLDLPNSIPAPEGWNLLVRLYQPKEAFFDGTWKLPEIKKLKG